MHSEMRFVYIDMILKLHANNVPWPYNFHGDHEFSLPLTLIQEGHLSVTDKGICTKYWL